MKAINEKGTIKTISTLKSYGNTIGLQYASDEKLKEIGFHDVVIPATKASEELGQIKWDSENGTRQVTTQRGEIVHSVLIVLDDLYNGYYKDRRAK